MSDYTYYNKNLHAELFGDKDDHMGRLFADVSAAVVNAQIEQVQELALRGISGGDRTRAEMAMAKVRTRLTVEGRSDVPYVWCLHPNKKPVNADKTLSPDALVKQLTAGSGFNVVSSSVTTRFRQWMNESRGGLDIISFGTTAPDETVVAVLRDLLGPTSVVGDLSDSDKALVRGITDYVLWAGSYATYVKRLLQLNHTPRISFVGLGDSVPIIKVCFDECVAEFKRVAKAVRRDTHPRDLDLWITGCLFSGRAKAGFPFKGGHADAAAQLTMQGKSGRTGWDVQVTRALNETKQQPNWGGGTRKRGRFNHPFDMFKTNSKLSVGAAANVKGGTEKTRIIYSCPELPRFFMKPYMTQMHKAISAMPEIALGFAWVNDGAGRLIREAARDLDCQVDELVYFCPDISGMDLDDDETKLRMWFGVAYSTVSLGVDVNREEVKALYDGCVEAYARRVTVVAPGTVVECRSGWPSGLDETSGFQSWWSKIVQKAIHKWICSILRTLRYHRKVYGDDVFGVFVRSEIMAAIALKFDSVDKFFADMAAYVKTHIGFTLKPSTLKFLDEPVFLGATIRKFVHPITHEVVFYPDFGPEKLTAILAYPRGVCPENLTPQQYAMARLVGAVLCAGWQHKESARFGANMLRRYMLNVSAVTAETSTQMGNVIMDMLPVCIGDIGEFAQVERYQELLDPSALWHLYTGRAEPNPLVESFDLTSAGADLDTLLTFDLDLPVEEAARAGISWADIEDAERATVQLKSGTAAASLAAAQADELAAGLVSAVGELDLETD